VVGKAQRQGNNCQGRIGKARAAECRCAGHIQIVCSVDAPVGIDHARTRISVHSGGTGMVVRIGIGPKARANFYLTETTRFER
jgi:hypothetical protein